MGEGDGVSKCVGAGVGVGTAVGDGAELAAACLIIVALFQTSFLPDFTHVNR